MIENPERENRLAKLTKLKEAGVHPHPERFERSHSVKELSALAVGTKVSAAGRIVRMRDMGKITFAHVQDMTGKIQLIFQRDKLGEENYKRFVKCSDLGDWSGVTGEIFVTKTGEQSVLVESWTFLGKALLPLPAKFHGLKDTEVLYRQRYLDLIANQDSMERFVFRSNLIRALREFYWRHGFLEVETATLLHNATGAAARPYHTHNNALDIDVVLRISHELPLKELVVGGMERVFELGKAFRNEGQDPSHLPEHTHLEHYAAFWNFEDNIRFTEQMIEFLFSELKLPWELEIKDRAGELHRVNFKPPFKRVNYLDLIRADCGIDVMEFSDANALRSEIRSKGIEFDAMNDMSLGTLIDNLYKKVSRPKLVQPTVLIGYPKILQPLARTNDSDPRFVDQFQVVVNGWEIVKAYSELVDPLDQRARFDEQAMAKAGGDEEAMDVDENYLVAMEHGMPPISGWGMGVDRLVALLTKQDNLRDVVLFPLVKPGVAGAGLQEETAVENS
jgi:lysyl-tRNA synthetase class 2